ncbi:site-specific integrase [uncultured Pseudoteredinibacter sp.]|uniref:site-specific integrase n=1 Tax=uncultured Pseudoteredinibacter sp. TaxID=1641701 RepID=UPI00261368B8|nr:site-specific integrase [uncultured Pseudoteredinibacter sp.]
MLQQRSSGIYYFRWSVPIKLRSIVKQTELYKTLHTKEQLIATQLSALISMELSKFLSMCTDETLEAYREVLSLEWAALKKKISQIKPPKTVIQGLLGDSNSLEEVERLRKLYKVGALLMTTEGYLNEHDQYSVFEQAAYPIGIPEPIKAIKENSPDLYHRMVKDRFAMNAIYHIHSSPQLPNNLTQHFPLSFTEAELEQLETHTTTITPDNSPPESRPITEYWKDYQQQKIVNGEWKSGSKTFKTHESWFKDFLDLLPAEISINDIDTSIAQDIISYTRRIPRYRKRRFEDQPLKEILEQEQQLSDGSINDRGSVIKGFFNWLLHNKHISQNPFTGLRWVVKAGYKPKQNYAVYTKKDLTELFNLPKPRILHRWQFWLPRVALFTGARQNEIAQLLTTDVIKSETGILYFSINDEENKRLKTGNAIRYVPIHDQLIDNGFIGYVNSLENGSLWPDLKPKGDSLGQQVSTYWNDRLKTYHKIPSNPTDERGGRKVFHSFRHNLITALVDNGQTTTIIQTIAGHEPSLLGETATYANKFSEASLRNCQKAINGYTPEGKISWDESVYKYKKTGK